MRWLYYRRVAPVDSLYWSPSSLHPYGNFLSPLSAVLRLPSALSNFLADISRYNNWTFSAKRHPSRLDLSSAFRTKDGWIIFFGEDSARDQRGEEDKPQSDIPRRGGLSIETFSIEAEWRWIVYILSRRHCLFSLLLAWSSAPPSCSLSSAFCSAPRLFL